MNCCIRALRTVKVTYFNSKRVVNAGIVFSQSIKEGSEREKVKWGEIKHENAALRIENIILV